ncbi:MAG TPA: hypothetical protein VIM84_12605 [Gemmatimonadales bacterium]
MKHIPASLTMVLVCTILLSACNQPTAFDEGCLMDFVPQGPAGGSSYAVGAADSVTVDSGHGPVSCLPLTAQTQHGLAAP